MKRMRLTVGLILAVWGLASCRATQVTSTTKDPAYNPRAMRRVLVIAVVRKPANQQLLENEFVQLLKKKGTDGVASHVIVPEGTNLDEAAWKQMIDTNNFDAVIVSRLIRMDVEQKGEETNSDPKLLKANTASGYYGYRYVYQPGYTSVPEQTAAMETRIFNVADNKVVWSARSNTDIEWGRDPEAQIRDFVQLMMHKIY